MDEKESGMYQNPTGDQFPILAWHSVPAAFTSEDRYKQLQEAGFNLSITQFPDILEAEKALEACKNTGVKLIVGFPELETDTVNSVNKLKGYSTLAGWFLGDEADPNKEPQSVFPKLKELSDLIYGIDSKHLSYYNLFPIYAEAFKGDAKSYSSYVTNYISIVNPTFVSFDNYPIISFDGIERVLRGDFFENLEIIKSSCGKRPFWAFYMAVKHGYYPTATIEDLRFEAFSALAFGAQCIQCFTYWQPEDYPDDKGEMIYFKDSPIGINGQMNDTFYVVQDINNEIKAVSNVFLGMTLLRIGYLGSSAERPSGLNQFTLSIEEISIDDVKGKGFLISYFFNNEKQYLLIVNCDIINNQDIDLRVKKNVKMIDRDGFITEFTSNTNLEKTIEPGDHLLFQF